MRPIHYGGMTLLTKWVRYMIGIIVAKISLRMLTRLEWCLKFSRPRVFFVMDHREILRERLCFLMRNCLEPNNLTSHFSPTSVSTYIQSFSPLHDYYRVFRSTGSQDRLKLFAILVDFINCLKLYLFHCKRHANVHSTTPTVK